MKRKRKILLTILPVMMFSLVLFLSFGSNVLATDNTDTGFPESSGNITAVDNMVNKICGNDLTIIQILAFAAIVITGVDICLHLQIKKQILKKV